MSSFATELEALERRGWNALSGRDGATFYQDLMAEDGLMIFPGAILDKAASIRAIAAAEPWGSFELSEVRVIAPTADTGAVSYRAEARRDNDQPYRALMSSFYARREGRWRLLLHQQTPGG